MRCVEDRFETEFAHAEIERLIVSSKSGFFTRTSALRHYRRNAMLRIKNAEN